MTKFMLIFIFVLIWVVCGYIHYGWYFAYFQREFPTLAKEEYKKDKIEAFLTSFWGPIALIVDIFCGLYKHGRKYN